jgi:hypothetical protein
LPPENISTQTANPYVTAPTDVTILYNTDGGVVTLTTTGILPGKFYRIVKINGATALTINAEGGAYLNDSGIGHAQADQIWTQWGRITFQWDGSEFWAVAH